MNKKKSTSNKKTSEELEKEAIIIRRKIYLPCELEYGKSRR